MPRDKFVFFHISMMIAVVMIMGMLVGVYIWSSQL